MSLNVIYRNPCSPSRRIGAGWMGGSPVHEKEMRDWGERRMVIDERKKM